VRKAVRDELWAFHPEIITGIAGLVLMVSMFAGCSRPDEMSAPPAQTILYPPAEPTNTYAGVYFFPVTGDQYRASLAAFLAANPDLRCRYFGPDDRQVAGGYYSHARIIGHTVVCRDTAEDAEEVTVP